MARLAREIGRGHDAIYHGTRNPNETLRSGKLIAQNGTRAICLTRSPEVAAYFASMLAREIEGWSPGVLVLNRSSLTQIYRLEPYRYADDWDDEQEERVWDRSVSFRRHLLGVVREADITKVLGPPKYRFEPLDFFKRRQAERSAFYREQRKAGDRLVRDGRTRVRDLIDRERKTRSAENARLHVAPTALGQSNPVVSRRSRNQQSRKVN